MQFEVTGIRFRHVDVSVIGGPPTFVNGAAEIEGHFWAEDHSRGSVTIPLTNAETQGIMTFVDAASKRAQIIAQQFHAGATKD